MSSALDCTLEELKVLKSECDIDEADIETVDNVSDLLSQTNWNVSNISLTIPIFYASFDRLYSGSTEVNNESNQCYTLEN